MLQHPGTQAGHAPPPAHAENAPYAAQVPRHAQVPQHTQVPDAGMPAFPPYRPHGGQAPPPVYAAGARAADASAPHRVDDARSTTLFPVLAGLGVFVSTLGVALIVVASSVGSAKTRLISPDAESRPLVAIAQEAEVAYCTKDFKEVLERVLHSCGLSTGNERRGCKPADIKTFAAISDADFNALFHPLEDRGGVLMFGEGEHELDQDAKELLEKRWFDRRGARYFFVVARASRTGTPSKNRALSHRRANSVMFHLEEVSGESRADLAKKVGLLWLGNEYAQLSADYCSWPLSRPGEKCEDEAINRSAFVSWVDCRL